MSISEFFVDLYVVPDLCLGSETWNKGKLTVVQGISIKVGET